MIPHDAHLHVGSLLFEGLDQIDLTGPFEVLSRIPNATCRIYGKTAMPVRDLKGLQLTPDATLTGAPPLDVLHVPGGSGQEALMDDAEVLGWIRQQASGACSIFSVCTGALICGAAGLLKGRRATTHWSAFHLLPFFGAIPVNERAVVDGAWVFAAGVTAGIDGALGLASELRRDAAAQAIQVTSPRHEWRGFLASRPRVPASAPCLAQRAPQADPEQVSFGVDIASPIAIGFPHSDRHDGFNFTSRPSRDNRQLMRFSKSMEVAFRIGVKHGGFPEARRLTPPWKGGGCA